MNFEPNLPKLEVLDDLIVFAEKNLAQEVRYYSRFDGSVGEVKTADYPGRLAGLRVSDIIQQN